MAGLRGQIRLPRADSRARRNSTNLASQVDFLDPNEVIDLTPAGKFTVNLDEDGGLVVTSGELGIDLIASSGLTLSASGLGVDVQGVLAIDASGVKLNFNTAGLSDVAGVLTLDPATSGNIGGVKQGGSVADTTANAVTLTSVSTTVTDPADAPVDADALRDDLVANALAEIRTALGNLATRDTELESAIENAGTILNALISRLESSGAIAT